MGERSSSGVRGIRAIFEAKGEVTSPPSRGRSPVGSEGARSTSSRPLSKVRTSFVTVERSGLLGPIIGLRKMSDTGDAIPRTGVEVEGDTRGLNTKQLLAEHQTDTSGESAQSVSNGTHILESSQEATPSSTVENINLDGPSSSLGPVQTIELETFVSKDKQSDTNGTVDGDSTAPRDIIEDSSTIPPKSSEDLGHVLKGSSFEPEEGIVGQVPTVQENSILELSSGVNNEESVTKNQNDSKSQSNGKVVASLKLAAESKILSSRPSAISTKRDTPQGPKSGQTQPSSKATKVGKPSTPKTPVTPSQNNHSKTSSPRQPIEKTSSSRQALPEKSTSRVSTGNSNKSPATNASRTSLVAKQWNGDTKYPSKPPPSNVGSSNRVTSTTSLKQPHSSTLPSGATEAKKSTTTSSSLPKKPTPKSPTRPSRLPAAATAATAASAAKLGASVSTNISHPAGSIGTNIDRKASTLKKDRPTATSRAVQGPSAAPPPQQKSSRPSILAGSHPADRPKSRASAVSSKQPDEGFLARMMRPTASSASKAHEKIESKSPPPKPPVTKSHRKSGALEEGKSRLSEHEPKAKAADGAASHESDKEGPVPGTGLTNGAGSAADPIST